jgi:phospholipid-binding lipoprotein MlaA
MKKAYGTLILSIFFLCIISVPCIAGDISIFPPDKAEIDNTISRPLFAEASEDITDKEEYEEDEDYLEEEEDDVQIADPFEPVNRFFFKVNDKLYFWVLKPVAKTYAAILPEKARIGVRNFFNNLATPIRLVNNLLQWKFRPAGQELLRFGVNSTVGILGLRDYARDRMDLTMKDEDFGQTLGVWGIGPVVYINWPVLGPSSLRDSIGAAGDYFLDPVSYVSPTLDRLAIRAGDKVNRTSLVIGDYEKIKKDAIDPYSAFKDIYSQYRQSKINR